MQNIFILGKRVYQKLFLNIILMFKCIILFILSILVVYIFIKQISSLILGGISAFLYVFTKELCTTFENYRIPYVLVAFSILCISLQIFQLFQVCFRIKFILFIYATIFTIMIVFAIPLSILGIMNIKKVNIFLKIVNIYGGKM